MEFIFINWFKYYTKEALRGVKVILFATSIIVTIVCIKYKPAYKVTLAGEYLGLVENKELIDTKIDNYLNDTKNNVAFREISNMPEYELKLVARNEDMNVQKIYDDVTSTVDTTYRFYAVTIDGENKGMVKTVEEAEEVINSYKDGILDGMKTDVGMAEVFVKENNYKDVNSFKEELNTIKVAKIEEYKEAEAKRKAEEEKKKRMAMAQASVATSGASGSINGMSLVTPVNGTITSRFGSVSSIRSSAHTGLDISTSAGTGIRPIASGTVSFAGYKGSYGNLLIIDHGGGIQSYYAHCSALYVGVGQTVDQGSVIAAVGSTGNSTGPHLHLEIRINGSPVNPQNYLY